MLPLATLASKLVTMLPPMRASMQTSELTSMLAATLAWVPAETQAWVLTLAVLE